MANKGNNMKAQQQIAVYVGLGKDDLQKAYEAWVAETGQTDEEAQGCLFGLPLMAGYALLNLYIGVDK